MKDEQKGSMLAVMNLELREGVRREEAVAKLYYPLTGVTET
jgi:hypothetical protein